MIGSRIGFVVYDRENNPDAMLREVVRRLKAQHIRVEGLLQDGAPSGSSECATMHLEDIGSGRRIQIFEQRGRGTRGCRLDPSGLAEVAAWLRQAIAERPEILFINRFGRQEAMGRGLVEEIGMALSADIPVILPVGRALLLDWKGFAGKEGASLANDPDAVEAWCRAQASRSIKAGPSSLSPA